MLDLDIYNPEKGFCTLDIQCLQSTPLSKPVQVCTSRRNCFKTKTCLYIQLIHCVNKFPKFSVSQ